MRKSLFFVEKSLNTVCCFFLSLMVLSVVLSIFDSGRASFFIIAMILVIALLIIFCYETKVYKYKWFWVTLFFVGAMAKLFVSIYIHADIISDMKHCLQAAQMTLNGDMSWQEEKYFVRFGFQVPFVLYEALILRIFNTTTALYLFNAFFSIATAYLVNRIVVNILKDEYCAWVISSLYMILPSTLIRISTLYNQILGGFFLAIGVYFYTVRYSNKNLLLRIFNTSVFLGIGYIFRQDVVIVFIAIICVELFYGIKKQVIIHNNIVDNIFFLKTLVFVIGLIFVFVAAVKSIDFIMRISHWAKYGIGNNAPLNTIIQGWTPENNGSYCIKYSYLNSETENMGLIKGIPYVINYISTHENMNIFDWMFFSFKKFHFMWGSVEGTYTLLKSNSIFSKIALCIACMEVPFYCGALVCAIYGMIKNDNYNKFRLLFCVCLIGYCLAYIVVEVQPRYRYNPMICLFILASFGVLKFKRRYLNISLAHN